jgi:predicted TIM-barrel fold metal-dependent hydrolase
MGIKLHPSARKINIRDLKNTGFFEFLSRVKLPILLHCSRGNTPGDFSDILSNFISEVVKYDLTISIAHAGFLDKKIKKIKEIKNVYLDISPWSVVIDSVYGQSGVELCTKKLTDIIKLFPNKILYGGDSPFDAQIWSNGERHGMGRKFDLMILNKAIKEIKKIDLIKDIFYHNPIKYLMNI